MGNIITLTGISGVGKNAIAEAIMRTNPQARMVPSLTTRPKRKTETAGEYRHISRKQMRDLHGEGRLLWHVPVKDHWYATESREVARVLKEPDTVGIMILVPSAIPTLDNFLGSLRRGQARTSIFLVPPPPQVFWFRLEQSDRDLTEIATRHIGEMCWQDQAEDSGMGFHFVRNDGTIEETAAKVLELLA